MPVANTASRRQVKNSDAAPKLEPALIVRRQVSKEPGADTRHSDLNLRTQEAPTAKWKSWKQRTFWGLVMIFGFIGIILSGHISVVIMAIAIQTIVFKEVISVSYAKYRERELAWSRTINWYQKDSF